jgi:hypothetical protein
MPIIFLQQQQKTGSSAGPGAEIFLGPLLIPNRNKLECLSMIVT